VGEREARDDAAPARDDVHLIYDGYFTECGIRRGLGLHYTTTPSLTSCPTCLSVSSAMLTAMVSLSVDNLTPEILFGETS
jgi:hypothetical protein